LAPTGLGQVLATSTATEASDSPETSQRFFSLRWKFSLTVLVLMGAALGLLSWRFNNQLEQQLAHQLQARHQQHLMLLAGLLDKSAQHLRNTTSAAIETLKGPLASYRQPLESQWQHLNRRDQIQTLNLYDRLGSAQLELGLPLPKELGRRWTSLASSSGDSLDLLACPSDCFLYNSRILKRAGNKIGALIAGTNLNDTIESFQMITLGDLAIVDTSRDPLSSPQLPSWQARILTLTNRMTNQPLLTHLSERYPAMADLPPLVTLEYGTDTYAVALVPLSELSSQLEVQQARLHLAIIDKVTDTRQIIKEELWRNIALACGSLLVVALCLIDLMWRYVNRLKHQAQLLPLLGQKQYQQVREELSHSRAQRYFRDELDTLDEAATTLSFQLESLEKAVELRTHEMERLSLFDPLTSLANRNLFQYEAQQAVNNYQQGNLKGAPIPKVGIILLDLDKFKRINDSLGHQLGDRLLGKIAERLKNATRSLGLVARLGGDEFAILVRNIKNAKQLELLSRKINQLIGKPVQIDSNKMVVSCSIGASIIAGKQAASDLIRHAEIAMYKAKDSGGNGYQLFDAAMATEAHRNLSLEAEIRRGFEHNEFTLYLQPKVNMDSGVEGFESLIRWDHPDRGTLPPNDFIPAMEDMGFISKLDNWVLEASCRQLHVWKELFPKISIAVNISSTHFTDRNFIAFLQSCLQKYPIDPKRLELEITETLLMENMHVGLEVISQIKNLGVHIAIDDFGTGYSSLSYLKNLPVDTLKIDREFIRDIPESESDMQISSIIIFLAKQLGFKVVAEGVETSEQLVFLKANQCDLAQGFYFSKPIPAHKAIVMLESQRLSN